MDGWLILLLLASAGVVCGQSACADVIAEAIATGVGYDEAFASAVAEGACGGVAIAEVAGSAQAAGNGQAVASALAEAITSSSGCGCPAADAYAAAIAEAFTEYGPANEVLQEQAVSQERFEIEEATVARWT
eukprot:TRINITY_DN2715_c0_g1_i1.p5 TRINITY_DN2715_c0_g1~~TRINITY_DN2715_c0_g1_i1.p5  ORF type:complete len:132 (-),score=34.65 TRINITY_DN2715_c0_g1_i1:180-575(-)